MEPLDYGRSFICHSAEFNSVRFWVESRTRLCGDETVDFHQCASCKSEDTFAAKNLFYEENYDFLPVFGGEDVLIFRRPAGLSDRYRQVCKAREVWGPPMFRLREASGVRELRGWRDIRKATVAGLPIISQTEIQDPSTGLRAIVECPVKTMNLSPKRRMYQVDTGPLCYPDLSQHHEPVISGLSLAFLAFNSESGTDFILERPTKVAGDDRELCYIYHYSRPFNVAARNRLFSTQ